MTKAIAEQRDYVSEFKQAFSAGIENIVAAAGVYVEAIDENPQNVDVFHESFADSIPSGAWSGFEAVGRKWMHPKLILGGGGQHAAKIKRLPYSAQERIFSGERFELLLDDGETIKADIRQLTKSQASQIIDKTHIRSLGEQRAYIEAHKVEDVIEAEVMPYTINAGVVSFRKGTKLTRSELKRLLQEM